MRLSNVRFVCISSSSLYVLARTRYDMEHEIPEAYNFRRSKRVKPRKSQLSHKIISRGSKTMQILAA